MVYSLVWMTKFLAAGSRTLHAVASRLEAAAARLREMRAAGVRLDPGGDTDHGFPVPTTDDPQVAERFGFEPPEAEDDC